MAETKRHCDAIIRQLEKLGIEDDAWLDVIKTNHEMPDGSGYPRGLKGDDITPQARLVGSADRLISLI